MDALGEAGVETERIALDPGVGFGKKLAHNLDLMRRIKSAFDPAGILNPGAIFD